MWPAMLSQSITGQRTAAAAKRSVWPITQLDSTPPPLHPETYMCDVSTNPLRDRRVHARHQIVVIGPG